LLIRRFTDEPIIFLLWYFVAIVTDEATGERILEIEVRGKRGGGLLQKHDRRSHAL
jgi:hypothetical protein